MRCSITYYFKLTLSVGSGGVSYLEYKKLMAYFSVLQKLLYYCKQCRPAETLHSAMSDLC